MDTKTSWKQVKSSGTFRRKVTRNRYKILNSYASNAKSTSVFSLLQPVTVSEIKTINNDKIAQ